MAAQKWGFNCFLLLQNMIEVEYLWILEAVGDHKKNWKIKNEKKLIIWKSKSHWFTLEPRNIADPKSDSGLYLEEQISFLFILVVSTACWFLNIIEAEAPEHVYLTFVQMWRTDSRHLFVSFFCLFIWICLFCWSTVEFVRSHGFVLDSELLHLLFCFAN